MFESARGSSPRDGCNGGVPPRRVPPALHVVDDDDDAYEPLTLAELPDWYSVALAARWAPPAEVLDRLALRPADEELAAALVVLRGRSLALEDEVRVLRLWERHIAWSSAQQQSWLLAVAGPVPQADEDDWAAEEVGAALRLSGMAGSKRIYVARMLDRRFSGALSLLDSGSITWLHTCALADETRHLDDEAARQVEQLVLARAPRQTVGAFRNAVRRAVIEVDAELAAQRHARARAGRRVQFTALPDGMAMVGAVLPAGDAMTVWRGLDALARRAKVDDPGDIRGIEARRADALTDVFSRILADPTLPRFKGRPAAVGVTADFATLCGLADHPGHLDGYGAIPASMARELAANGDWKLLVTDALSGRLQSIGSLRYRPGATLAEFLVARDRTCRFPNCVQPGYRCHIDHRVPYDHDAPAAGGQTDEDNCWLLCERHHRLKHETCWRIDVVGSDVVEWVSPAGQRYTVDTEDLGPMQLRPPGQRPPDLIYGGPDKRAGRKPDPPPTVELDPPF